MDEDARIVRAAIDTEIDGYRFFLDSAGTATHPKVRDVWLSLAADEIDHMRILQGQLASLECTGEWETLDTVGSPSSLPKRAPVTTGLDPAPTEFGSDLDALRSGLQVEDNTYRFYADAARRSTSPLGRKAYEQLAALEMGHYRLVEETIAYLGSPEQWQFGQVPPVQEG